MFHLGLAFNTQVADRGRYCEVLQRPGGQQRLVQAPSKTWWPAEVGTGTFKDLVANRGWYRHLQGMGRGEENDLSDLTLNSFKRRAVQVHLELASCTFNVQPNFTAGLSLALIQSCVKSL